MQINVRENREHEINSRRTRFKITHKKTGKSGTGNTTETYKMIWLRKKENRLVFMFVDWLEKMGNRCGAGNWSRETELNTACETFDMLIFPFTPEIQQLCNMPFFIGFHLVQPFQQRANNVTPVRYVK